MMSVVLATLLPAPPATQACKKACTQSSQDLVVHERVQREHHCKLAAPAGPWPAKDSGLQGWLDHSNAYADIRLNTPLVWHSCGI